MRDFIEGWGLLMLYHYGLIKVLRVEVYAEYTIRLMGVCLGRHPHGQLGDRSNHAFIEHITEGALNLFPVLYEYLPLGVLDRVDLGSVLMV